MRKACFEILPFVVKVVIVTVLQAVVVNGGVMALVPIRLLSDSVRYLACTGKTF